MEGGQPDVSENYSVVKVGDLKVYVPNETVFSGDIPRIVDFSRRNGQRDVGVPNVIF